MAKPRDQLRSRKLDSLGVHPEVPTARLRLSVKGARRQDRAAIYSLWRNLVALAMPTALVFVPAAQAFSASPLLAPLQFCPPIAMQENRTMG